MRASSALLLLVLALSVTSPALAQSSDELIEQGVALREEGRDEEALALFEQAYQDAGTGEALAQIALAETALGRVVEAEAHLVSALAETDDRFVRRHRAALQQALDELRTGLGDLELHGGPPGAEVWIGETSRGLLPLAGPIRVPVGTVRVEIRADGFVSQESSVDVSADDVATLEVSLVAVPSRAPEPEPVVEEPRTPPPPSPPPPAPSILLPIGVGAAAAGVVLVGVATGLMVLREDSARTRLTCSDGDPGCRALFQTAVDAEAAGVALFVVGGALAATGAVLVALELLGGDEGERSALSCAPGALALSCAGRF